MLPMGDETRRRKQPSIPFNVPLNFVLSSLRVLRSYTASAKTKVKSKVIAWRILGEDGNQVFHVTTGQNTEREDPGGRGWD